MLHYPSSLNKSRTVKEYLFYLYFPELTFTILSSIIHYSLNHNCIYLIGQKLVGQNFRQTKYFVGQNFRQQAEISTILSDFCLTFVLKYRTKFSTDKIFHRTKFSSPSQNLVNFVRRFFVR